MIGWVILRIREHCSGLESDDRRCWSPPSSNNLSWRLRFPLPDAQVGKPFVYLLIRDSTKDGQLFLLLSGWKDMRTVRIRPGSHGVSRDLRQWIAELGVDVVAVVAVVVATVVVVIVAVSAASAAILVVAATTVVATVAVADVVVFLVIFVVVAAACNVVAYQLLSR